MTGKRGVTLIEAVIAIAVIAIVVVALLQALSFATSGAMDTSLKTTALNLAKTQLEYVKSQSYNTSFKGNLSRDYGVINASNMSSNRNYTISGNVSYVNASNPKLQKITVNVSYANGKQVQVIGYKNADQGGNMTYTYPNVTVWAWQRAIRESDYDTCHWPGSPAMYLLDVACGNGGASYNGNTYLKSATPADLQNVATQNDSYWKTQLLPSTLTIFNAGDWNTQMYTFQIPQVKSSIQNISVTWIGHGSQAGWGGSGGTDWDWTEINVYNVVAGSWTRIHSEEDVGSDETWGPYSLPNNAQNYVDDSGNLSVLVGSQYSAQISCGKQLWTDYIGITVTTVLIPIALAPQDDGINPLPYLAEAPSNNSLLARDAGITYQYRFYPENTITAVPSNVTSTSGEETVPFAQ